MLRRSDQRLRIIAEAVPIPMAISRLRDGLILYANGHLGRTFGLPPEEMVGRKTPEFYYDLADRDLLLDLLEKDGYVHDHEIRAKKADGTPFWIVVSIQKTTFDGELAAIAGFYDVTERREAEEALRESEGKFRALSESADAVIFIVQGTRFVYVNSALEAAMGYSREEFFAMDFWEFVHPEYRELMKERGLARQRGEQVPSRYEFKAMTKSGEERWFDLAAGFIEFEGKPAVVGTAFDITERRQAEEALRQAEAKNEALLVAIPDMMFRMDKDGVYLEFIPGKGSEPLVPPSQFLGKTARDVLPAQVAEQSERYRDRALRTGEPQLFEYQLTLDDNVHDYECRIVACADDEVLAIVRDVTGRKLAEAALRDSEERYRVLYEDNPTMYFTVDAGGTILSVNRFGAEQLGYTADELVGQSVLRVFYDEDKEAVQQQLAACVRGPGEVADWEFRKVRKDGSLMWVKEAARAVRGPDGDTIVLIVCEDITERKRAEEALQEAREELESKVESQLQRGSSYALTFRELMVLHLVADGNSDREIATVLGISPRTVNKHLENILTKMGASSRTEAGVRAVREGLLG